MKSKFFLSLLAVLTIATFTSSASAATCNYTTGIACSVQNSVIVGGGGLGCASSSDIMYNGKCLKNCSACSSGFTRKQQVYTDSSGCTISYYSCLLDASLEGEECATTTYAELPSGAQYLVASDADLSCMHADTSYRCTSGRPKYCVADCSICEASSGALTVGSVTVTAPSGCTMTYQGCKSISGDFDDTIGCSSDADCGTASAWGFTLMGKQSRTVPKCSSGSCTTNTEYRCVAGYYGTLRRVGLEIKLSCTKCSAGYYSSEAGATSCTACPDGSYTNAASGAISCLSCAEKTGNEYATSVAPAAGIGSCFVPAGTFTVGDETGNKGFVEDCYYEDDSGTVVNPSNPGLEV